MRIITRNNENAGKGNGGGDDGGGCVDGGGCMDGGGDHDSDGRGDDDSDGSDNDDSGDNDGGSLGMVISLSVKKRKAIMKMVIEFKIWKQKNVK